ncbi:hypothetical protein L208DRAFT_1393971 [Tricholoma matsutake]|nr:hypothetical protein L208DRAFT_1393971 [Tricholoma matsutake 945]
MWNATLGFAMLRATACRTPESSAKCLIQIVAIFNRTDSYLEIGSCIQIFICTASGLCENLCCAPNYPTYG